jgi:hypothetical protein
MQRGARTRCTGNQGAAGAQQAVAQDRSAARVRAEQAGKAAVQAGQMEGRNDNQHRRSMPVLEGLPPGRQPIPPPPPPPPPPHQPPPCRRRPRRRRGPAASLPAPAAGPARSTAPPPAQSRAGRSEKLKKASRLKGGVVKGPWRWQQARSRARACSGSAANLRCAIAPPPGASPSAPATQASDTCRAGTSAAGTVPHENTSQAPPPQKHTSGSADTRADRRGRRRGGGARGSEATTAAASASRPRPAPVQAGRMALRA